MPFAEHRSFTKTRIGRPVSLGRAHVDPATIVLTFVYQELVQQSGIWVVQEKQQVLQRDTHYKLDRRQGIIMLIDHPFWQQEGRWQAPDRVEPLLYKDRVKHPQRVEFSFEYYQPEEIKASEVTDEIDQEARERLGYDLPRYTLASEAEATIPPAFDWED